MSFKDTLKNAKKKVGKKGKATKGKSDNKKGMGFKAAVASARKKSKGKLDEEGAAAAIAAASRNASPAAKAANPNLKKVK